jgi:hypothetical protein
VAQAPRVLLIGKKIGRWISLSEATQLRLCGYSQDLRGYGRLFPSPTFLETSDVALPYVVTRDRSSKCYASTYLLKPDSRPASLDASH